MDPMRVLRRTQFGNPILRARATPVPLAFLKTAAFRTLVKQMFHTMHRAHGVGLAAPQVGKSIRLAVIRGGGVRRVIVNPKILSKSPQKALDWEGCLSFPDGRGKVPRARTVKVRFTDVHGRVRTETHRGYAARIFQHEIDHLDGKVYVDRMTDMRTLMTHKEFVKRVVR